MSELDVLDVAAGGMSVERAMLDLAARNVAAAQASSATHPYTRLVARVEREAAGDVDERAMPDVHVIGADDEADDEAPPPHVTGIPSGETADALTEMIAVLDAQRAYEANASVFDVGKRLAERTLDVGRF